MTTRPRAALLGLLLLAAPLPAADPLDEALRLAPPDAAVCLVVPNARATARTLADSPFAEWFPTTAAGRGVLGSPEVRKLRAVLEAVSTHLGTRPAELLDDVFGDAVVFAFAPGPPGRPDDETGVLLVRPRKPDVLAGILKRLNDAQTGSGEVKAVETLPHDGGEYTERRKTDGSAEFYAFRGGVFAFSARKSAVLAVIDRDRAAPPADAPWAARLDRVGLRTAAAVVLINPRALDAEMAAKAAAAPPEERPLFDRLRPYWAALDTAAVHLTLGAAAEAGVVAKFRPDALPADGRRWLSGTGTVSAVWSAVPESALAAAAGRLTVSDVTESLGGLMPATGRAAVKGSVERTLGPVVGRDKLAGVLDALGPDWGAWAVPPTGGGLPAAVFAVRVRSDGPDGEAAAKSLAGAVEYGFQTARVMYNFSHPDQIDLREEKDGAADLKYLSGDRAFPAGLRPAFALKDGFLVVATSPDAVRAFVAPKGPPVKAAEVPILRVSGSGLRDYLTANRDLLAAMSPKGSRDAVAELDQMIALLEPLARLDLVSRGGDATLRVTARLTLAKPLQK